MSKLLLPPEQFRDWYYATVIGRPFNGKHNNNRRRGEQKQEYRATDWWREFMGFDAPWCNGDMILYDHGTVKALAEIKVNSEQFSPSNRSALISLGRLARLAVYSFRFWFEDSLLRQIEVAVLRDERKAEAA